MVHGMPSMKCHNCLSNAVYQLDDPRGSVICVSCGAIASWRYVYMVQSASQANADMATIECLELELLRAKLAGKVPGAQ